jgi:acyl-CoA synthetase (AMP-forming)/AMP-acid ligase II
VNRTWLLERLAGWADRVALVGPEGTSTYAELIAGAAVWTETLDSAGVKPGRVVAFEGDYGTSSVSLLIALVQRGAIALPLASAVGSQKAEFLETACAEWLIGCDAGQTIALLPRGKAPRHPLLERLAQSGNPGLILFSSGSTGRAKAMLHDFTRLLEKFQVRRSAGRMLSFLLLDHIGGINTLLHGLTNGGTVVTVRDRQPETVCEAIECHGVEVLPASPTFLNLLLLSEAYLRYDLSSLLLITYGTELMPASTLTRLRDMFPNVRLQQTYGLSELGILRSKSREDGSLWVKVGGEGYETKVVGGTLWIRARTSMLGYLNADNPFDAEGWFNTQDAVEQDGEWLRFLGRTSEIINVGGQKVYPSEVESVLLEMDHVQDAAVHGEQHPLIGQCVVARVNLSRPETAPDFKARMRRHCQGKLAPYMIPVKVEITDQELVSARGKRLRR